MTKLRVYHANSSVSLYLGTDLGALSQNATI